MGTWARIGDKGPEDNLFDSDFTRQSAIRYEAIPIFVGSAEGKGRMGLGKNRTVIFNHAALSASGR